MNPARLWISVSIGRARRIGPDVVLHLLLGALLLWMSIALAAERSPAERQHLMRIWALCGAGIVTVATPHILFPQKNFRYHLLTVPQKGQLLMLQLRRASPLLLLSLIPVIVTAVAGGAVISALASAMHLAGVWMLAVGTYVRLGRRSQEWQEGTRGGWYRRGLEYTSMPPALPDGSMPLMLTTTGLFAAAIVTVLVWSALRGAGTLMIIPSGILLLVGVAEIMRLRRRVDAEVFHTQAFFDEILRMTGGLREAQREAATYESIYWAPHRLRPAIWAQLVQMDRRAPLGRLVAAGHLFLWILMWNQGYDAAVIGYLLTFSLAKNMAPALIAGEDASPPAFDRLMQPASSWIWTRAFASLRWTLPWALSLGIISIFAESFPANLILLWTGIDVALAIGAAFLITLLTEYRHRRSLA